MTEFDELRRQLRIAYGKVIADCRKGRWPTQLAFAKAIGMKLNTYRRIELGERAVTAPELDVIAYVLGAHPDNLAAEARELVSRGKIPSHATRAAESWRRALNPRRPD